MTNRTNSPSAAPQLSRRVVCLTPALLALAPVANGQGVLTNIAGDLGGAWPVLDTLAAFKLHWSQLGEITPSAWVTLDVPAVALRVEAVAVQVAFSGPGAVACGVFLRPSQRQAINNKFDGPDPAAFVAKFSPRMGPQWSFTIKFERSTRIMAVVVGSNGLWSTEAEVKLGYSAKQNDGGITLPRPTPLRDKSHH